MNGAGLVGWLFWPSTRTAPSAITRPVAVASRCFLVLVFTEKPSATFESTLVSSGPTPVQVTSKDTGCRRVELKSSLTNPSPVAVTLLRFWVLVMVAGTTLRRPQLTWEPSWQGALYCTLAVGSGSSVSGDSKSRVLRTNRVACTIEPSAHSCGTAQKASAVSSKK